MLVIFTAFSWYPITRLVVLSLQSTNLVDPPSWVGLQNFRDVWNDPLFMTAREEHGVLRAPRPALRLPDPAHRGGLDQRVTALPRCLQRSGVPPRRHSAGCRRDALEVRVLRAEQRRALQHRARLVPHGSLRMAAVDGHGDARARRRVDMGQCRHHGDHLPRGTDVRRPSICTTPHRSTAQASGEKSGT